MITTICYKPQTGFLSAYIIVLSIHGRIVIVAVRVGDLL